MLLNLIINIKLHVSLIVPKFCEHKLVVSIHIWPWNIYTTIKALVRTTLGSKYLNVTCFVINYNLIGSFSSTYTHF